MLQAMTIWVMIIFNVAALFTVVIVSDVIIARQGGVTITDFLRLNPGWFWWPACLYVIFFISLALHLFAG